LLLRWFLVARLVFPIGRILVLMMIVGVLGAIDQHDYVWAACFAGSAVLARCLLGRWRRIPNPRRRKLARPARLAWTNMSPGELAARC